MSTQIISVFNNTLTKTNAILDEINNELDWDDRKRAYKALKSVLHVLRDLLSIEEATDLAAQLPMLVKGFFFDGWNPNHAPSAIRNSATFIATVNARFPEYGDDGNSDYIDPEAITRAVLKVLSEHVSPGEIKDVVSCLPEGLRELWK